MKKTSIITIFITIFIDLVSFGIVIPLLPFYAQRFGASGMIIGLLVSVFSMVTFIFLPVLGRLSDQRGRRPVLLISMLISAVAYILFAFAGSLWMLFLSRFMAGIGNSNLSAAQAYIADITPPNERAKGMGIIGAAFGLGFIFGPLISAFFSAEMFGEWQYALPGLIAAGLSIMNFILAYFFLPESLHDHHRQAAQRFQLFDFKTFLKVIQHPGLRVIVLIFSIVTLAYSNIFVTIPLFVSHAPFNLSAAEVSWFFIEIGLIAALVQGLLIGRITGLFGERLLVITGTLGLWFGFMIFPLSTFLPAGQVIGLAVGTALLGLGSSFFTPNIMSMASQMTGMNEQGTVMGMIHSLASLSRMIGPFIGGIVYDAGGPNSPYYFSIIMMIAAVCCLLILPSANKHNVD
jgi:MFS transporter, DHA1 family, tetracycline resistance protein